MTHKAAKDMTPEEASAEFHRICTVRERCLDWAQDRYRIAQCIADEDPSYQTTLEKIRVLKSKAERTKEEEDNIRTWEICLRLLLSLYVPFGSQYEELLLRYPKPIQATP